MNTFQNIILRTEQFMKRTGYVTDLKALSKEDNMEAKSLMDSLVELAENQNTYPQNVEVDFVTDEQIQKINGYYVWLECLN